MGCNRTKAHRHKVFIPFFIVLGIIGSVGYMKYSLSLIGLLGKDEKKHQPLGKVKGLKS